MGGQGGGYAPLGSLGEAQLQIQFTQMSMYDSQAMGLWALNGGLVAAAIAAESLLGSFWWLTLIGFLLSSISCALALTVAGEETGPDIKPLLVPAAKATEEEMNRAIAIAVSDAVKDNLRQIKDKRKWVWVAMALLAITIFSATLSVLFW